MSDDMDGDLEQRAMSRREFCNGRALLALGSGMLRNLRRGLRERLEPAAAAHQAEAPRPASIEAPTPRHFPLHRPPGAIDEEAFLRSCERCLACANACPHDAIIAAPIRFRQAAGTPIIDALQQPCLDCEDRPCATACPAGVIDPRLPSAMATAQVDDDQCIAGTSFCSSCVERCPVEGAIALDQGRVRIDPEVCTGCGVCHHVCPAPVNAIRLLPTRQRPPAPTPGSDAS